MSGVAIEPALISLVTPIELPDEISSEWLELYLRPIERWWPAARDSFTAWPDRPNCGHFFGGSYWYGFETAHPAYTGAVLWRALTDLDITSDIDTDLLKSQLIAAIRYLGFTHDSGPADCVRVKGPNPHCSGTKWGGANDGFFMASQTAGGVTTMGMAAWLLWDELDDETRQLVINVAQWYADRWCDEETRVGTYHDTQMEENGWTSSGIDFAACFLPGHPHASKWREGADRWAAAVRPTPYDCARNAEPLQGKRASEWFIGATTHPDFTTENHDFVHPNYMGSGISYGGWVASHHALAGIEIPEVALFNLQPLYDTLKKWAEDDGIVTCVQGQDWWYLNHYHDSRMHCLMNLFAADPHAAYLERRSIRRAIEVMDDLDPGNLFTNNPEECRINAYQNMRTAEYGSMQGHAQGLLLHWKLGDGVEPCTQDEFNEWLTGVHEFPYGGIIIRKSPSRDYACDNESACPGMCGLPCGRPGTTASFSWRNRPDIFVQPAAGTWTITPNPHSLAGTFTCDPAWEGGDSDGRVSTRRCDTGFSAIAKIQREGGRLNQYVALIVPDDDIAFFFDRTFAAEDVTVTEQRSGLVGVRNERYPSLGELAPGGRSFYTEGATFTSESRLSVSDEWFRTDNTDWANIDNQIGYVAVGSKGFAYQSRHSYPRYAAMEDLLMLSYCDDATAYSAGDKISDLALVIYPNQTAEVTRAQVGTIIRNATPGDMDAILSYDYLALINTADVSRQAILDFDNPDWEMVPVPDGCTVRSQGGIFCETVAEPFSASVRNCQLHIERSAANWEATAGCNGHHFIRLVGDEPTKVLVTVTRARMELSFHLKLEPGRIVQV